MIRGITIQLQVTSENGVDEFNRPFVTEEWIDVNNVLVGEPSDNDIINQQELEGRHWQYTLAIPKGDTHDWQNKLVRIWGETYKTFGHVTQGIEVNIPLLWNKKVKVEKYG